MRLHANAGNQIADANEQIEYTREQIAALERASKDGLLPIFADLASYATTIATSLGEGGKGLARGAALLGPLLNGLSALREGLQERDQDGKIVTSKGKDGNLVVNTVGLLSSLFGKNGSASQSQSIGGTLQVIGAVVAIADAVDLFGTRARQKAKEMREAAAAFNVALDDFLVVQRTTLEQQLRDNIAKAEQLRQQAAAAAGLELKGGAITSTADIRSQIAELTQLGSLKGLPVGVREQFLKLRDAMQKLLGTTEENEKTYEAMQAAELASPEGIARSAEAVCERTQRRGGRIARPAGPRRGNRPHHGEVRRCGKGVRRRAEEGHCRGARRRQSRKGTRRRVCLARR